jgi:PAS domain S-box-containing protein
MSSPLTPVAPPVATLPHGSLRSWLQRAGACLIVVVALADFFRWQAFAAKRISFGHVVPMAPATEWLFVMLGVALGLQLFFPRSLMARRIAAVLSTLAALATLHVLFSHLDGRVPPWESWFDFGRMTVDGFTIHYISTKSAVLLMFSNFALLALLSPLAGRSVVRDAGIFTALAVELFALVTVVSYAAGNSPVMNDGWLRVAPIMLLEFTLFNFVLLMSDRATNRLRYWFFGTDPSAADFALVSREEKRVFGLLAGLGLMAVAAGVVYLRFETKNYQTRSFEALQSMSDLKVYQIEQWRRERLGDARTLMRAPFLAEAVRSLGSDPTAEATRAELTEWLRVFVQEYGYAKVVVLNRAMEPVLTEPGQPDLSTAGLRERFHALRPDSGVIELPPYLDGAGVLRWDLLVPLHTFQSPSLEGAILLQTDPTRSVIRMLESWRAEYQTGQSMLWYREGDRLISLGGYRPVPGATPDELRPFGMIRSLSDPEQSQSMLTRMARGELSMGEGLDHRGVMIIGGGRPIANSPWLLSSRVDSTEVYAPLRRNAIGVACAIAALLASMGFATSWLWRQRQKNLLHDRFTAELEQKRLAARLGMVMQHAKDIIIVTDEKMRFVDVNQQAVDTYGWTKEEMLRLTIQDIRAPETLKDVPGDLARINSGEGAIFETTHRRKDHTTFPVESSVRRVEIDGQPHMLSIIRDISERKRVDAALRASEERYRLIADNTSDVIWLYDLLADRFTYASPSALPLLGYKPEEIVGRKLLDFVAPASGDAARRALEQILHAATGARTPVHLTIELDQQRKDGSIVPTEVVTSVLSDTSGRVTHILGVTRDTSERRKARETLEKFNTDLEEQVELRTAELAARNREIEALVESIPDTVLLCDERGELVTSHFARSRASSAPFADVGGGDGLSHHHPVLIEIARELHAFAWASQQAVMIEFDRNISGTDYSIEARATPAGQNRLLILLRDISARKRGERLAQANLERERQLSEMKSQFISVASHEFRTPLAAAVGSLELLERHAARLTDAKRGELLVRAQRSLGRLTEIMNDVLQVSRADSGRMKVKLMNVDLGRFVQDVVNEVAEGDRQAHTFSFQQSGGPSTVPADTNLLNHVVSNLVGNAARYSPAGTTVSVALTLDAEAFTVTVADEGIGIPVAERERIFEPFVRGSNVGQIGGTGLGLNIVKRYTELMGGRIEVLPTDRGATFRVRVPCANPAPSQ